MDRSPLLHPDRLFASDPRQRDIARELHASVRHLPIVSPHGHTDPNWFADNKPFPDASELLDQARSLPVAHAVQPGIELQSLGLAPTDDGDRVEDPARVWQIFADHCHLFRGTPTSLWMNHVLGVFAIDEPLEQRYGPGDLRRHKPPAGDPNSVPGPCSSDSTSSHRHHGIASGYP